MEKSQNHAGKLKKVTMIKVFNNGELEWKHNETFDFYLNPVHLKHYNTEYRCYII